MTRPQDNRPPPKEPTDDAARNDRGDAAALAEAPGEADTTLDGPEGIGGAGPQDTPWTATGRKLPAPAVAR